MILAAICILVAGLFLVRRDLDKAFVFAVLGLVAWLLNYRARIKGVIAAADLERSTQADAEANYEDSDND